MGIRIHKDIGCFIEEKNFKGIIKDNFHDILEELDYETSKKQAFQQTMEHLATSRPKRDVMAWYWNTQTKGKWDVDVLIRKMYFYDDFAGLLFRNPDEHKNSRYDDNIDYYESFDENDEPCLCKIKWLNQPVYPVSGYWYHGGLEEYPQHAKNLEYTGWKAGEQITSDHIFRFRKDFKSLVLNEKLFSPQQDSINYMSACAAGLLEDGVTEEQFCKWVRPAIITSWG